MKIVRININRVWRKLHNEELHDLYSSSTIVLVIKWGSMILVENVARLGWGEAGVGFWWGNLKERTTGETQG
jgi:hypothetical protein